MKKALWLFLLLLTLPAPGTEQPTPQRVVSTNLCTDQLLLLLAAPGQIASVSRLALEAESSFMAEAASRYPVNDAKVEQLLAMQPDLILGSAYAPHPATHLLRSLGYRLEYLPLASNIGEIRSNIRRVAGLLGNLARGERLIERMDLRLERVAAERNPTPPALFYQPRGYTSGTETLQNEALRLAGWRNISAGLGIRGYGTIDLESLLLAEPAQIFTSAYAPGTASLAQRRMQHPALQRITANRPIIDIAYKYWICGGPMIADAVEALAEAHDRRTGSQP
jgi:iron complex transport system substrate-binding protein